MATPTSGQLLPRLSSTLGMEVHILLNHRRKADLESTHYQILLLQIPDQTITFFTGHKSLKDGFDHNQQRAIVLQHGSCRTMTTGKTTRGLS